MGTGPCFHCGEPLAGRNELRARVQGAEVAVCCPGCRAAAELIADLGLADFYRYRTAPAAKPQPSAAAWLAYDAPGVLEALTQGEATARSIVLLIDGLTCAACGWLITRALLQIHGVAHASVNTATGRTKIAWNHAEVPLSRLLAAIDALGYRPRPLTAEASRQHCQDERRDMLKRLAVAGLGMMQVMMFAVAMYAGSAQGMDASIRAYLRLVSLLVATPVMLYGGWPFFLGAARALRTRGVTMDVPVSVGLLLAYGASVFDTWRGAGEVYFDSVTMFIFFLTVARYVEMVARHRSSDVGDALCRLLPATAHRMPEDGSGESPRDVPVLELACGDRVLVRAGEAVPADGEILCGSTRIDESMLTGESTAVARGRGERLAAGTINLEAPVQLRVKAVGPATILSNIVALFDRAQAERPRITRVADRIANRFLLLTLAGALVVCLIWLTVDPGRAFPATLALLVAACPCALSLATLVAVASANAALARRGVLAVHPNAVEGLARADHVVFDKTGTLTSGVVGVSAVTTHDPHRAHECLKIAAALEAACEHPIGRGFAVHCPDTPPATECRVVPGAGIEGVVGGRRYRIGTPNFALDAAAADDAAIVLAEAGVALACFALDGVLRADAVPALDALRRQGLRLEISSGDSPQAVQRLAAACGITRYASRQSPQDKLQRIRTLAAGGAFVATVGDGINDAPLLGGAGVSIAMGRGSALAQASADLILVGDRLASLPEAFLVARRTRAIIRQNLVWSVGYNFTAMPLAALGLLPPWMAAIGMSMSSILVVLNSMRVMRRPAAGARREAAVGPTGDLALAARSTV